MIARRSSRHLRHRLGQATFPSELASTFTGDKMDPLALPKGRPSQPLKKIPLRDPEMFGFSKSVPYATKQKSSSRDVRLVQKRNLINKRTVWRRHLCCYAATEKIPWYFPV